MTWAMRKPFDTKGSIFFHVKLLAMLEGVVALLAGTLSDQKEQSSPADMWGTYIVRRKYI